MDSERVCEKHWFQGVAKGKGIKGKELEGVWVVQGKRCPYSGERISPPAMALDVVEGPVWVTRAVRAMKGKMSRGEFVDLCRVILNEVD